jgi:hypothetical protein
MLDECATLQRSGLTTVCVDAKKGWENMKQEYVAPSVKVLGSLEDLTLGKVKSLELTPDGYELAKKIALTS